MAHNQKSKMVRTSPVQAPIESDRSASDSDYDSDADPDAPPGFYVQLMKLPRPVAIVPTAPRLKGQVYPPSGESFVYILKVKVDGKDMLKIAREDDPSARLGANGEFFDVRELYSVTPTTKTYKLERELKCRFLCYKYVVEVGGERFTDVYYGLSAEKADEIVQTCAREIDATDSRSFQLRMKEEDRKMKEEDRKMKELERDMMDQQIRLEELRLERRLLERA